MMIAMGCDTDIKTVKDLYFRAKKSQIDKVDITLGEYADMISMFVDEQCDPIEGLIETIEERFDQGKTGRCKYSDIVLLMEEN